MAYLKPILLRMDLKIPSPQHFLIQIVISRTLLFHLIIYLISPALLGPLDAKISEFLSSIGHNRCRNFYLSRQEKL